VRMTGVQPKQLIVDVTAALVAQYGVEGTTIVRSVSAAGISEKTLYSHLANRKDILVAALNVVFERASGDRDGAHSTGHSRLTAQL
jgi:AcrR family transcriptional regulator